MKRSMSVPLIPEVAAMEDKATIPMPSSPNLLNRRIISGSIVSLPGDIVIKMVPLEGSPKRQVREWRIVRGERYQCGGEGIQEGD